MRHYREAGLALRAQEVAEKLVTINPLSVRSLKELASIYMYLGRLDESQALYEQSIELGNTGPNWAEGAARMTACREDLECMLDNLYPPHQPYKDRLRTVYREPADTAEAQESIDVAMQVFHEDPEIFTNWFNGSACEVEHLTPLFFMVWEGSRERGSYWFWPNVWGDNCNNVYSTQEFPEFVESVGLVEYWRRAGWPDACQPQGEGFACGSNIETE